MNLWKSLLKMISQDGDILWIQRKIKLRVDLYRHRYHVVGKATILIAYSLICKNRRYKKLQ